MLKLEQQIEMSFSPYKGIYDILIPKSSKWRRMAEEMDFSFFLDSVKDRKNIVIVDATHPS